MALTCAVIIPTMNRPQELRSCLDSLLKQTRLPEQIIIVDDGQEDEADLRARLAPYPGEFIYHRKQENPGSARSKNLGTALATTDVVCFLDDDVVLEPEYLAELMRVHEEDTEGVVGGVGGVITDFRLSRLECAYDTLRGRPRWGHGRVFPNGLGECNYNVVREPRAVEWLSTCACSYRRHIAEQFPFYEGFSQYSLYEDLEMSYRVSRQWRLIVTPKARLSHHPGPHSRYAKPDQFAYQQIVNLWYHFARNMPHRPLNYLAFGWMLSFMLVADIVLLVFSPRSVRTHGHYLKAHARAIWDCVVHRRHLRLAEGQGPYSCPPSVPAANTK